MSDAPLWVTAGSLFLLAGQYVIDSALRIRTSVRSQADKVTAWIDQGGDEAHEVVRLVNTSGDPVFNVIVTVVLVFGGGARRGEDAPSHTVLSILPPEQWRTTVEGGWAGMYRHPGIELAFTDKAGRHWIRRSSGKVQRVRWREPWRKYGMEQPFAVTLPTRAAD